MNKLIPAGLAAALLAAAPASARTLVVAISSNLSGDARADVNDVLGGIYDQTAPGDHVIFLDANHLTQVADFEEPADGYPSKKAKAKALGPVFQKVYDLTGGSSDDVRPNDLNIPELLLYVGRNILPAAEQQQAHVLLLGSVVFDNPRDAGWSFREFVPSDGMLLKLNTIFNISGREHLLNGALVSICYTDKGDIRESKDGVHKNWITRFWGKTISGQGGQVGALMPISTACAARLTSDVVTKETFPINRNDPPELVKNSWIYVGVRDQSRP